MRPRVGPFQGSWIQYRPWHAFCTILFCEFPFFSSLVSLSLLAPVSSGPTALAPNRERMKRRQKDSRSARTETCLHCHSYTINSTETTLGLNSDLCEEQQETNRMNPGTTLAQCRERLHIASNPRQSSPAT
jgi:hypothetical protein